MNTGQIKSALLEPKQSGGTVTHISCVTAIALHVGRKESQSLLLTLEIGPWLGLPF